jgi:hypothetical protein
MNKKILIKNNKLKINKKNIKFRIITINNNLLNIFSNTNKVNKNNKISWNKCKWNNKKIIYFNNNWWIFNKIINYFKNKYVNNKKNWKKK